ncbi:MAG: glycosyltransferase [Lachnospiraceae bacterium]
MQLEQQNILFILRTMEIGGTEKVVLQLCRILKDRVHKIVVCSNGGSYVTQLEKMGIKHYMIPNMENKTPGIICKTAAVISEILKKEEITIVHTHHRMAAFYARLLYGRYPFLHVATAHNIFENKKFLTRYSYGKAHLIACGESVRDNLTEYYEIPKEKITVIHNSVEFYEASKEEIPELQKWKDRGYHLVGNIGRLELQKGMEYFIRSYSVVKAACDKVKFIIVGDGSEASHLKNLVKEMGLQDEILFLGRRDDVRRIMQYMDVVVLSSLWEGYPLTPIEAFSVGKTVVATRVAGTTEIVIDGENGILVEPANPDDLAGGIKELLFDSETRKKLETNAYTTYCSQNAFSVFSGQILDYYQEL